MKKLLLSLFIFAALLSGCNKKDNSPDSVQEKIISENTIVVSNSEIASSLIAVDSTKLIFKSSGIGIDKIKVGSILVSDMSTVAPFGFLRKVTRVATSGNNTVLKTEQASLTDAILNGKVSFQKTFTDADIIGVDSSGIDISTQRGGKGSSFNFGYNKVLYDADGNYSTTGDQLKVKGDMRLEPSLDFDLDIAHGKVSKFFVRCTLKNTNNISVESRAVLAGFGKEIVLITFQLQPFTISIVGIPVPIAKQWIAIVLGVDGSLSARVTTGVQNINTAVAGISYLDNTWNTTNTIDNSFTFSPLILEGAGNIEPWVQARYEIRPYGIKESKIYLGIRGSLIAEAVLIPTGLSKSVKWGVKLSAKAQMQIWDRAVLDYENIFFEREFPISQSTSTVLPSLTTLDVSEISTTTAKSGGNISSDGGAPVTVRGVCWSISQNPTIANGKTSDNTGVGTFTSKIGGLTPNTKYYLRAYATNTSGTGYGNEITFTTTKTVSITLPTLTTTSIKNITLSSALSGGNITSDGGSPLTSRGVCWSSSANPTISNNKTFDGSGIGLFSSSITGLTPNTTYYIRAYATNSIGTGYGNEIKFTTAKDENSGEYKLVFSDDFSDGSATENKFNFYDPNNNQGKTVAHSVVNNYLELRMDVTDANANAVVNYDFSTAGTIKIVCDLYYHEGVKFNGSSYFFPQVTLAEYSPSNHQITGGNVQFLMQTNYYSPDNPCGDNTHPSLRYWNASVPGSNSSCPANFKRSNTFASATSATFYDKWLNDVTLIFNKSDGKISVDIEGDGLTDLEGYVPNSFANKLNTIMFSPYGWFTGHLMRVRNLKIYTK